MAYLLLVDGDFFATRPCLAVLLCFRSFRKFSLAYCLSCLVFALFVRVPHFCIEMIFDNRLTFFCDCARFFFCVQCVWFFLRISRKLYSGFMCLAASLPDAAVGRWRVFCVNGGTFCLDGAKPFFFCRFLLFRFRISQCLAVYFPIFCVVIFSFLPRLLCVLCRSRNCRLFFIYRPPLLPTAIRRVFY